MPAPAPASLAIAQVAPYPLEHDHPVTAHARRLADELAARGHRVVVLAPAVDPRTVRDARRRLARDREDVLPEPGEAPPVLALGEALPPIPGLRRAATLPVDAARAMRDALGLLPLDVVHVHEPFAPSIAALALRHSRALNAATFHLPTPRFVAGQLAGRRTSLLLGRLDVRLAASRAAADAVAPHLHDALPYAVLVPPPADLREPAAPPEGLRDGGAGPTPPVHLVVSADEERGALRRALRALRRLASAPAWRATVLVPRGGLPAPTVPEALRDRVAFLPDASAGRGGIPDDADVLVLATDGTRPAPHALVAALHAGVVPVAPRVPVYDELCSGGERGLLVDPEDAAALADGLARVVAERTLRLALRDEGLGWASGRGWADHAAATESAYGTAVARRHDPERFSPGVVARVRGRPLVDVDLHMHTDHSHDCATPVEVLLATARREGLGAIAVTDHDEVSGALEAARAAERFGVKVVVGEEVKTAAEGEVIGLFLHERIPGGMTMRATVDAIRAQGGVVYVPHPFDRLHSVPDYAGLLPVLADVDAIEVHNPRVALRAVNEEAARFAGKYRVLAGAGSDSHVAPGLGSVRLRMRDFDGPDEFLTSLRDAELHVHGASYAYVQTLKFLETKATPPAARERRAARRRRRAVRGT